MYFSKPEQVAPDKVFKVNVTFFNALHPDFLLGICSPVTYPTPFQGRHNLLQTPNPLLKTLSAETDLALCITSPPCYRLWTQTTISHMGQGDLCSLGHQSVQTGRDSRAC